MIPTVSSLPPSPPSVAPQPSPWHSPIPYLFGGLAAMMGLISFALLVLACSYWKLSGNIENGDRDIESGEGNTDGNSAPGNYTNREEASDMEEKYFVIMAGEAKPTFLATPSSSRATSFRSSSWRSNSTAVTERTSSSEVEMAEEVGRNDVLQGGDTEEQQSADRLR